MITFREKIGYFDTSLFKGPLKTFTVFLGMYTVNIAKLSGQNIK